MGPGRGRSNRRQQSLRADDKPECVVLPFGRLAPGSTAATPVLLDAGECGLVVEFGRSVDPALNDLVLALDSALLAADIPGIEEVMPTYRSLMIHYDPTMISRDELAGRVLELMTRPAALRKSRRWIFPACYDPELGIDLEQVAWAVSLSASQVVSAHSSVSYRIFMHGFAPGLPAMGGLPAEIRVPRRMAPRLLVPEGSLIIAAGQASIASVDMPCGWHVLGRTPERLFVLDRQPAFLTSTGDEIRFEPIDLDTFAQLRKRALAGETIARVKA